MKNLYNVNKYRVALEMVNDGFFFYKDGRIWRQKKFDNQGNVFDLPEPETSTNISTNGYYRIYCKGAQVFEHVLVYVIFNGIDSLDTFQCIDHLNAIKTDNRIENLEGVSIHENSMRAERMGLVTRTYGELNGICKLSSFDVVRIKGMRELGLTQLEIADIMGVTQGHISDVLNGKSRKYA